MLALLSPAQAQTSSAMTVLDPGFADQLQSMVAPLAALGPALLGIVSMLQAVPAAISSMQMQMNERDAQTQQELHHFKEQNQQLQVCTYTSGIQESVKHMHTNTHQISLLRLLEYYVDDQDKLIWFRTCSTISPCKGSCLLLCHYYMLFQLHMISCVADIVIYQQGHDVQDELSKVNGKIKTGSEIIDKNSRDVDKLKVLNFLACFYPAH